MELKEAAEIITKFYNMNEDGKGMSEVLPEIQKMINGYKASNSGANAGYASPASSGVQNGGRWTKIEDEEPPEMGTYIVFNGRNVTTANWDKYGFYNVSPGGSFKVNVEQWMPLPDAP